MMLQLATDRGLYVVVENPLNSLLFKYGPMRMMLAKIGARRVSLKLSSFGAESAKPLELWGTAPWLEKLPSKGTCGSASAQLLTRTSINADGRKSVTGRKGVMTSSAAYPKAFGEAVAALHAEVLEPALGIVVQDLMFSIEDEMGLQ